MSVEVTAVHPEPPEPTYTISGVTQAQAMTLLALAGRMGLSSGLAARDEPYNISDIYWQLSELLYPGEGGYMNPVTVREEGGVLVIRDKQRWEA